MNSVASLRSQHTKISKIPNRLNNNSPDGQSLLIQPRKDGKAKVYQVQQFIKYQQEEE